ncbi:MAG: hypothetical protein ACK5LC_02180, partial [Coprobacillaceae bacterium]
DTTICGPDVTNPSIFTISYVIKSGPSTDFIITGLYEVTYTATNPDEKMVSITVDVLVISDTSESDSTGDVKIDATGFSIKNEEAELLTKDIAKDENHGNSNAYYTRRDQDNTIIGYQDITENITVDKDHLEAIQKAPKEGGFYTLQYRVKEDGKVAIKTVNVIVEGTITPPPESTEDGDSLAITGTNFTITHSEALALDDNNAILEGSVESILVQAGTQITDITVDQDELVDINNASINGGEYPLTYVATYDDGASNITTISVTLIVTVQASITPPVITTVNQEYYVGDTVNLLEGVSAVEETNVDITLVEDDNVTITNTISMQDKKYTVAGTYEVSYEIEDSRGNTATETKIIKVHELPTIIASHQEYQLGDSTIQSNVENNPTASWKKAKEVVGEAPEEIMISGPATPLAINDTISYSITSGPSTDFSVEGVYEVTYTATNIEGRTTDKTIQVLITPKDIEVDPTNTIQLYAEGFILENIEAKDLTEAVALLKGKASSYFTTRDEQDVVIEYSNITNMIIMDQRQLEEIQKAPTIGGIYDLTYTVTKDGYSVTKVVKVVVLGDTTPPPIPTPDGDSLAITAKDITLTQKEAKAFASDEAMYLSEVQAWLINAGIKVTNINVNQEQLLPIQSVGIGGGVFDLTFTATYEDTKGNTTMISTTIKVTVEAEIASSQSNNISNNEVNTGDSTNIYMYIMLLFLSITFLTFRKYKVRNT